MGASESGVVNGGDMETVVQLPHPDEDTDDEDQKFHSSLRKKNSILSLTLEEIQFRSGKSFGSMNMDEFMASVWRAEDNQPLTSQTESNNNNGDSRQGSAPTGKSVLTKQGSAPTGKSVLTKQGSFSIPTPLCNKTVDEVWYEIHKDDNHHHHRQPLDANNLELPPHSQQTFGEMTLEDFLFKAGVMQEEQMQSPTASTQKQTVVGFSDIVTPYMLGVTNNGLSGNGYAASAYQIRGQNSNRHMGEVVSLKNRRIVDGPLEAVVERRHRRMIKNRESAARSRARKQAYTVELEVELNQQKEENEKLKRIVEETERKRKKEILKRKYPNKVEKMSERATAMRRTTSSAW